MNKFQTCFRLFSMFVSKRRNQRDFIIEKQQASVAISKDNSKEQLNKNQTSFENEIKIAKEWDQEFKNLDCRNL